MTNKINIIFDNSDLHIQENLDPKNLKIFFGVEDAPPLIPCDYNWSDIDGDKVDLDCTCSEIWLDIDGDKVDLDINCSGSTSDCSYKWDDIPVGVGVDFNCNCATPPSESNDFIIDCGGQTVTTDLGRILINSNGENVKFEIHGLEIYNSYTGEYVDFDLTINRNELSFSGSIGEQFSKFELFRERIINFDIPIGEYSAFNVLFAPIAYFNPFMYIGESSSVVLSSISILEPSYITTGESTQVTLKTSTYENLPFTAYAGESSDVTFNTIKGFNSESCTGECVAVDLEYDIYTGFPFDVQAGESLANFDLFRHRILYTDPIDMGEYVNDTVLNTYPAALMEFKSDAGESVDIKLLADIHLGNFNFYEGHSITKFKLNELENYKAEMGETAEFTLSTSVLLSASSNTGENSKFDFKPGLPQHLSFKIENGESLSLTDLRTLRAIDFRIRLNIGERVNMNDWAKEAFHIDLDDRACCNFITGNLTHVELDDAPYNWTSYDFLLNACEMVTFDLSTRPAIKFDIDAGEVFKYENTLNTFDFVAYEGQYSYVPSLRTITTIDLEEGNNEPENPVVDIDRPDIPSEFKYIAMYHGEDAKFKMEASYALSSNFSNSGEQINVSILFNPPFRFNSYGGEYCTAVVNTNIQIPLKMYAGEMSIVNLYEPPFLAYAGESVEINLDTKSDYYAEFITDGCLDNQYYDIDPETGQPLPQEYNGTSVEGEMFLSYVEGRCF